MATSNINIDTGSTLSLATVTVNEDAIDKHIGRSVLNDSSGNELGIAAAPLLVNLAAIGSGTLAKINTVSTVSSVANIASVGALVSVTGTINTVSTISSVANIASVGAIVTVAGTINTVSTIGSVANIASVGAVVTVGNINTVSTVGALANILSVGTVVTVAGTSSVSTVGAVANITSVGAAVTVTGIINTVSTVASVANIASVGAIVSVTGTINTVSTVATVVSVNTVSTVSFVKAVVLSSGTDVIGAVKKDKMNYISTTKYLAITTAGIGMVWDPAASNKVVLTDLVVSVRSSSIVSLLAGTTTKGTFHLYDMGGVVINFVSPFFADVDTNVQIVSSASTAYVTMSGYETT